MMTKIVTQGTNGGMFIDDDETKIRHTAPLFPGKRGVTLDTHNLQTVVYKRAYALINGFLRLVPKGDNSTFYQTVSLRQVGRDELAITLMASENTNSKGAEYFYNYVVGCSNQIKAAENNQL